MECFASSCCSLRPLQACTADIPPFLMANPCCSLRPLQACTADIPPFLMASPCCAPGCKRLSNSPPCRLALFVL